VKITPIDDRVVLRPEKEPEETKGGILIPENARKKQLRGEVLAVGPGKWTQDLSSRRPLAVKVGDVVLYTRYSGSEFELDGEKLLVFREEDLLGILGDWKSPEVPAE
jgi:chaperonin GroES